MTSKHAALALALASGCATGPAVSRPLDEDLLAILPADAELVMDFDLAQIRGWHLGNEVKELVYQRLPIPAALRDKLWESDQIVVAVRGLAQWSSARVVWVGKGESPLPPPPAGATGLRTRAQLGEFAVVRLGARLWAGGPADEVDKVVDRIDRHVLAGPGELLREILQLAPSGKYGRPAVRAAARLPGELSGRLAEVLPAIAATDDIALAFAVADGFDLGLVLRMRSAADARAGTERLRRDLQGLVDRPLVSLLGLGPLLDPLRTGAKDHDMHVAYRLPRRAAEAFVERCKSLLRLIEGVLQQAKEGQT